MSYTSTCYKCGDRYDGGSHEEALLSNPKYNYDPTDFECKPCLKKEEEIIQELMENEWFEQQCNGGPRLHNE